MVFAERFCPLSDLATTPWSRQNRYYSQWRKSRPRYVYWLSPCHPAQSTMEAKQDSQCAVLSKGLTGLLGKTATYSSGFKTGSLAMWGTIILIFSSTSASPFFHGFFHPCSLQDPGTCPVYLKPWQLVLWKALGLARRAQSLCSPSTLPPWEAIGRRAVITLLVPVPPFFVLAVIIGNI